jgi:hypothetical protein
MCSNNNGYVLFAGYNNINNINNWPPYTPIPKSPTNTYYNVFNFFINQQTSLSLQGSTTFSSNTVTIKNSVYDSKNKTYICGSFTLSSPSNTQNIAYLQGGTWFSLGLTFNSNSFINCMVIYSNLLFIGGQFSTVTDSNQNTYTMANFAVINIGIDSSYTVNTIIPPPTGSSQINSLVFVEQTLYVGGIDTSNNIYFYSYNITLMEWTNLFKPSLPGSINILYNIPNTNPSSSIPNILAIGGQFTSIGTATNCNNIVLYNTGTGEWTPLGTEGNYGVIGIGTTSPLLPSSVVYTITSSLGTNNYIFIGGYFVSASGTKCNSLVIYNYLNNIWIPYYPTLTTTPSINPGVLNDNSNPTTTPPTPPSSTDPGIVYSLIIYSSDNSNLLIGGSFYINTNVTVLGISIYLYNSFKVTTNSQNLIYGPFYTRTITTPST